MNVHRLFLTLLLLGVLPVPSQAQIIGPLCDSYQTDSELVVSSNPNSVEGTTYTGSTASDSWVSGDPSDLTALLIPEHRWAIKDIHQAYYISLIGLVVTPHFPRLSYLDRTTNGYEIFGVGNVPNLGTLSADTSRYVWKIQNLRTDAIYYISVTYTVPSAGLSGLDLYSLEYTRALHQESSSQGFSDASFDSSDTELFSVTESRLNRSPDQTSALSTGWDCGDIYVYLEPATLLEHTDLRFGDTYHYTLYTESLSGSDWQSMDSVEVSDSQTLSLSLDAPTVTITRKKLKKKKQSKSSSVQTAVKIRGKKKKRRNKRFANVLTVSTPASYLSNYLEVGNTIEAIVLKDGVALDGIKTTTGTVEDFFNSGNVALTPPTVQLPKKGKGELQVQYKIGYTVGEETFYTNLSDAATVTIGK
ncbi:MAG: hypothetical protein KDD70_08650 [Bdellovibrionales bacterium]|nr:hypothetical protein [Bdellovibrionales bacterium]